MQPLKRICTGVFHAICAKDQGNICLVLALQKVLGRVEYAWGWRYMQVMSFHRLNSLLLHRIIRRQCNVALGDCWERNYLISKTCVQYLFKLNKITAYKWLIFFELRQNFCSYVLQDVIQIFNYSFALLLWRTQGIRSHTGCSKLLVRLTFCKRRCRLQNSTGSWHFVSRFQLHVT